MTLPIIHHDSSQMRVSLLFVMLLLSGCVAVPQNAFVVTDDLLQQRQQESRRYSGISEEDLLAACANLLQDMGFNLENSETSLGVITASKLRDAGSLAKSVGSFLIAALAGTEYVADKDQTIRVSLVVRRAVDSKGQEMQRSHYVRVTFQRIVRRSDNSTVSSILREEEIYRGFYERLSKSIFIEAQAI